MSYKTILEKFTAADFIGTAYAVVGTDIMKKSFLNPPLRARRSSDNAELDIIKAGSGYCGSCTENFATTGIAFATTLYDQMGSNNFVQTTAASQPKFYDWTHPISGTAAGIRGFGQLSNGDVLVGNINDRKIYIKKNNSNIYDPAGVSLSAPAYSVCVLNNGYILVPSGGTSISRSINGGSSYSDILVTGASGIRECVQLSNGEVLAFDSGNGKVFVSTDNGGNWALRSTLTAGLRAGSQHPNGQVFVVNTTDNKVYKSIDNGSTWDSGILVEAGGTLYGICSLTTGEILITTVTSNKIYISKDFGATWQYTNISYSGVCIRQLNDSYIYSSTISGSGGMAKFSYANGVLTRLPFDYKSIVFSGSQYMECPHFAGVDYNAEFSIVFTISGVSRTIVEYIINKTADIITAKGWAIRLSAGGITFAFFNGSASTIVALSTGVNLADGKKYSAVITYKNGVFNLYVNGVLNNTVSNAGILSSDLNNSVRVLLGAREVAGSTTSNWVGNLHNFAIVPRELQQYEAEAITRNLAL